MRATEIDISSAIQTRSKFLQRLRGQETAEQRLVRFELLQKSSFELLHSSPEGFGHFLKRNLHARRVKVIDGKWHPVSADRRVGEA